MNAIDPMLQPPPSQPLPEEPELSRHMRRAVWLVAGLFATIVFLAALLRIEGAVIASGQIGVESGVKTIIHPSGGILGNLLVEEGDQVSRGQVLMTLDSAVSGSALETSKLNRNQLLARAARLRAEREGASRVGFPSELTVDADPSERRAVHEELRLFQLGVSERASTAALLDQRIAQSREQIRSREAELDAARRQLDLIRPELEGLRKLYEQGYVTINRMNQMERTAVQLEAAMAAVDASIAELQSRITEIELEKLRQRQAARTAAGAELAQVEAQLNDQTTRLVAASETQTRNRIVAPQAGIVDDIAFRTSGSAIPANTPILTLVPSDDRYIVEAQVMPGDTDELAVGQRAIVRLSSLNQELSPEIVGELAFLSPDRSVDPDTGSAFYRAEVSVAQDAMTRAGGVALRPGTPVEVFFQTGSRSILSYLFKPLTDQLAHALR